MAKHTKRQYITTDLPYKQYMDREREIPKRFSWSNHNGENYLTRSLNQHLPVYCGSCWAHAAVTVLADRIKIMRKLSSGENDPDNKDANVNFPDVALSIQFILNCGGEIAGSCHGGNYNMDID